MIAVRLLTAVAFVLGLMLLFVPISEPAAPRGLPAVAQSDSPSPTPSGSPSSSPSSSPTGSPTATPVPDPDYRRVTLTASRREVRVGKDVVFSGRVRANRVECSVGSRVVLRRVIFGTRRALVAGEARTDGEGRFRIRDTIRWSSIYYAVASSGAGCRREESDPVDVRARVWFSVKVNDPTPERFTNFRLFGRVRPSHPHTRVVLQERRRRGWVTVQREDLSDRSSFSFFPYADWRGERSFRVKWFQADRDHETAASRTLVITTH